MGNCLNTIKGRLWKYSKMMKEQCLNYLYTRRGKKRHFMPMKDDEQHATIMSSEEISNMIQKHQQSENAPLNNLNEYKIIKSTAEEDEEKNLLSSIPQEIEEIKKEVNAIEIEHDDENNDDNDNHQEKSEENNKENT